MFNRRLNILVSEFVVNSFNQTYNYVYASSHMHSPYIHDNSLIQEHEKAQFWICVKTLTLTLALARFDLKICKDLILPTVGLHDHGGGIRASVAPTPPTTTPKI